MAFKVNLLMKGIITPGWVEIWRLPEAEAEHSLEGSDKPLLMEKGVELCHSELSNEEV